MLKEKKNLFGILKIRDGMFLYSKNFFFPVFKN